jgi:hypothetical protein
MKRSIDSKPSKKDPTKKTVLRAIREKCLDCCAGSHSEVRHCHLKDCSLWPFRMGKNPYHKRKISDKDKDRLKNL